MSTMKTNNNNCKNTMYSGGMAYLFSIIALEPAALQHFSITDKLFTIAQFFMFSIVFIVSFGKHTMIKHLKEKRVSIMLIIFYTYLLSNTAIHHGRTYAVLIQAIHFIGFALYLDLLLKNNPSELFRSILNFLTFLLLLNCIIVYTMQDGLYRTSYYSNNYLLGYDNQNINFILPTLVLVLIKDKCYKKCKFQLIITYVAAWLIAIKIWSGMTLVVTFLMTAVAVILSFNKGSIKEENAVGIINLKNLIYVDLVANIALVLLRLQYYFEFLIVYVLHKSITLTSRTIIWDRNIELIKKNPIWGYGREQYSYRAGKIGFSGDHPAGLHAHNRLLETMYSGGIIMLALLIGMLFYSAYRLDNCKDSLFIKILSFGIFIYLFGMLSEYYDYCIFLWGFLVIADNSNYLVKSMNDNKGSDYY